MSVGNFFTFLSENFHALLASENSILLVK